MGGYERDTTPTLSRLAAEDAAEWFGDCFAHARWTPASTASMLTGTYLTTHGVGLESGDVRRVPERLDTVPELLRTAGYQTACVSTNGYLSEATGLDRGFDRFLWPSKRDIPRNLSSVLRYGAKVRHHRKLPLDAKRRNLTFRVATDTATRWIDSFDRSSDPFFLYMHYNNPHHPYSPPHPDLVDFLTDVDLTPSEAVDIASRVSENLWEIMADGCQLSDREWEALRATYDAEIVAADRLVEEVLDHLESLGMTNTIVVVTGDHGELFGEQGLLGHNLTLHDGLLHVPMVVRGLDGVGDRTVDIVQHVDVMQTILNRIGVSTDQFQGVDLTEESRQYAVAQRGPRTDDIERLRSLNPSYDTSRFHEPMLHTIRSLEYKYMKSADRAELFAVPDETTDIQADKPKLADRLDEALEQWLRTIDSGDVRGESAEFTDEMEDQLRQLGYL
jgi:uncharacterized sulfatase